MAILESKEIGLLVIDLLADDRIDPTDAKILRMRIENPCVSNVEIADAIGVSEKTVRSRLQRISNELERA